MTKIWFLRFIYLLYLFLVFYILLDNKTLFVCADDIMAVNRKIRDIRDLIVGNHTFQVTDFKHLGNNINSKNNTHNEIKLRI